MKLTDFLEGVGRPVAYHPGLKKITGSTTATIMLCQFIYWRGKESDPDGWLYKSSDEIETETGLSYDEQKTARKKLIGLGFMEEYYARLDHQMKFRLNLNAIDDAWGKAILNIPESGNTALGKAVLDDSLNESETTPETTLTPQAASDDFPPVTVPPSTPPMRKVEKKGDGVDMLLAYAGKAQGKVDVGFLYEHLRPLATAFIQAAGDGHKPVKSDHKKWCKFIGEWYELRYTPEQITKAVEKMRRDGLTIGGPESVTKIARDIQYTPAKKASSNYVDVF